MTPHRRPFHLTRLFLAAGLILPLLAGCAQVRDRRVLIMNFENSVSGGDKTAQYSSSLAELMTSCLANSQRVVILDRQDLAGLLSRTTGEHALRWQEIGRRAGADYVIVGSISRLDQNFIINARLLSVTTGKIVNGSSVTRYARREEDIYPAVQAICDVLSYQIKFLAELYDAKVTGKDVQRPAAALAPVSGMPSVPDPGVQITQ
jgi:TolB-like protein